MERLLRLSIYDQNMNFFHMKTNIQQVWLMKFVQLIYQMI